MNPAKSLVLMLGVLLAVLCSCGGAVSTRDSAKADIIVYGSATCGYTTATLQELDDRDLDYVFKDVLEDKSAEDEMWDKLWATDWYEGGYVDFPVVDVGGTLLVRPAIEEIEALL